MIYKQGVFLCAQKPCFSRAKVKLPLVICIDMNKDVRIVMRISSKDKEAFRAKADALGYKSLSRYIKKVILSEKEIRPKADVELMAQIRRIGVNINQIAATCNYFKSDKVIYDLKDDLKEEINKLNAILDKI